MVFAVLALAPVNSLKIYQHENMKSAATTTSLQQIVRFRPLLIFTVPSHLISSVLMQEILGNYCQLLVAYC